MNFSKKFLNLMCNNNKYEIIEQIGDGAYGMVFHATLKNSHLEAWHSSEAKKQNSLSSPSFALKLQHLRSAYEKESFINEILYGELLKNSTHIVQLIESYKFTYEREEFGVLCYEKMEMDLMDYILMKGRLNELEAKEIFREVCLALSHCHRNSIAHLDLKPENILLSFNSHNHSIRAVKLCDFGFTKKFNAHSKLVLKNNTMNSRTLFGTKEYRAPEIKKKRLFGFFDKNLSFYADKADIWSLGATLFVMVTGCFPFEDDSSSSNNNNNNMMMNNNNMMMYSNDKPPDLRSLNKIKLFCDDRCYQMLLRMMNLSAKKRPNIMEVLNHSWLNYEDIMSMSSHTMDTDTIERIDKLEMDMSEEEDDRSSFTPSKKQFPARFNGNFPLCCTI